MNLPDPMLLSERKDLSVLGRPGWIYEVKFDGYRIVAGAVKGAVHLRTRNGADATKWFPEVAAGLATLPGGPHILDGEVVVMDDVRSDFNRLQDRARRRRWFEGADPVVFMAFDAMAIEGRPLIGLPVERRKDALQQLLAGIDEPAVRYVDHFDAEHGRSLYQQAVKLKLEGLVAKRVGSLYVPGERTEDWLKVKRPGAVPPERFKR